MLVLVRYDDENYDIVEDYCLEYLIVTGKVVEFSRSDRWVKVGTEPVREKHYIGECYPKTTGYTGPERRRKPHSNLLHTPLLTATN